MQYKIVVDKQSRTNPSAERREYIIDIEELRCKGDVYDSLVITKDEDYVMRRLELTEYHVLNILDNPIKEPLNNFNIELFEGDNYIYLIDMVGNKFYAEYIVKNDFTDTYITKAEFNSGIEQTAKQIELSVNEKLTGYSTTTEMNAAIKLESDNITSEVKKKVGNDEVISKINQSSEKISINANKIELSANDILNLLSGNEINLGSKNIIIKSDNFNVDKKGNVDCSNINITGGTIDLSGQENDTVKIKVFKESGTLSSNMTPGGFVLKDGDTVRFWANPTLTVIRSPNGTSTTIAGGYIQQSDYSGENTIISNGLNGSISCVSLIQTSLESQKKNFEKLEKALDIIKQVDIYKYNLKNEKEGSKKHFGFVIGDKYNYSKELTSNENNGVDIYSLSSCCLAAIQEQQEEIEILKKEIEKLKGEYTNE